MAALRKAATRQCLVVFMCRRVRHLRQILRVAAILQLSEHTSEEVWIRRLVSTTGARTAGAELQQLNQLIDARQIRRPGQAPAGIRRVAAAKVRRPPALTARTRRKQELQVAVALIQVPPERVGRRST